MVCASPLEVCSHVSKESPPLQATALPSYYKHLADDAEGATAEPGTGDRGCAGEPVFGPYGPPEGDAARAGLGSRRQDDSSATEQGYGPHMQQPPVGELL